MADPRLTSRDHTTDPTPHLDSMMPTALKLLRKAASYTGGAAAGIAFTAAVVGGPVGALGVTGLLGIIALCLATETATEVLEPEPARLARIEHWLEELVRRHGSLDAAIQAIAEAKEPNPLVSRQAAGSLRIVFSAPDDQLATLAEHDVAIGKMLSAVTARLLSMDARAVAALEQQAEQLGANRLDLHRDPSREPSPGPIWLPLHRRRPAGVALGSG